MGVGKWESTGALFWKWTWAMSLENTFIPACVCHGGDDWVTIRSPQCCSSNVTTICSHRIQNQWPSTHNTSHKLLLTAIFLFFFSLKMNTPSASIAWHTNLQRTTVCVYVCAHCSSMTLFSVQFSSFLIAHILTTVTYIGQCRWCFCFWFNFTLSQSRLCFSFFFFFFFLFYFLRFLLNGDSQLLIFFFYCVTFINYSKRLCALCSTVFGCDTNNFSH